MPPHFLGPYLMIIKTIDGGLKEVQKGIKALVENIHNFATQIKTSDVIKLLIPQQFVAKIIGVGNPWDVITDKRWKYYSGNLFNLWWSTSQNRNRQGKGTRYG